MPEDLPSVTPYETLEPISHPAVIVVPPPRPRYWLHALLFAATVLSTLSIGARLQYDFNRNVPPFSDDPHFLPWSWGLADWHRLALGLPFSACLLGILTAHEFGHYIYCVRRRVSATLPFFIPAPTLIGTLGAFIRIQSPIRSRRDLFDIGIAGPIAGFLVAVPVLFFSLLACKPLADQTRNGDLILGLPLIFRAAHWVLAAAGSHAPAARLEAADLYLHPAAVAAWVGMFATALNLLPGGQLDGGHIVFALRPSAHRRVSWLVILALIPLSLYFSSSWLIWALVLRFTGQHPPVPVWPGLDGTRKKVAVLGLLMLVLTFSYNPLPHTGLLELIQHWKH